MVFHVVVPFTAVYYLFFSLPFRKACRGTLLLWFSYRLLASVHIYKKINYMISKNRHNVDLNGVWHTVFLRDKQIFAQNRNIKI